MKDEPEIPNCRNCRYFYITWDAKKPYGCRAMQFKSSVLPTIEVLEADGAVCISFRKKKLEGHARLSIDFCASFLVGRARPPRTPTLTNPRHARDATSHDERLMS